MNWQEVPFVRLLVPFAAGITLYEYAADAAGWAYVFPVSGAGLILLSWAGRRPLSPRFRLWVGLALLAMFMGLGGWSARQFDSNRMAWHFSREPTPYALMGVVEEVQRYGAVLGVRAVCPPAGGWRPARGRLLAYLPPADTARRGDTLVMTAGPVRIPPARNPEAFDFGRYLARRGVFHQVYLKPGTYIRGGRELRRPGLREHCLAILRRHLADPEAFAVGAAITLGHRGALEADLREAYAASGAIHILAVSGLHVGLVYLGLHLLLGGLSRRGAGGRLLGVALELAGVWGFVALAGLPPSAVRAATMFSFFSVSRAGNRSANSYNILAASAFCMLLVRPVLLFDVGFQLSYTAVAGIIALQRGIYRTVCFSARPADYLWSLLSVALAAQLGTSALGMYYFHQFPLFFWLSGLVAVPAASLMLGGGLALLALDPVPGLGDLLGAALQHLIRGVNACICYISRLPGARLEGVWVDEVAVVLYYLILFAVVVFLRRPRAGRLLLLLALLLALSCWRAGRAWEISRQQRLTIYYVHGHTLIDLFDGRRRFTLYDEALPAEVVARAAQHHRWARGVRPAVDTVISAVQHHTYWRARAGLLQFHRLRLLIVGPETTTSGRLPSLPVDLILVQGDPAISPEALLTSVSARQLVFDASNKPWNAGRWRAACRRRGMAFHDIREQGALVVDRAGALPPERPDD